MPFTTKRYTKSGKIKIRLNHFRAYLVFPLSFFSLLIFFLGYGEYMEVGVLKRAILSCVILAPFVFAALLSPYHMPSCIASAIIPLKILINNGYINHLTMHLLILIVCLSLFNKPKRSRFKGGETTAVLFLCLTGIQLLRAQDIALGLNKFLDCFDVIVFLYFCTSHLPNDRLYEILDAYLVGAIISLCFILVTHDWGSGLRLGECILLNPNFVGVTLSLSLIYLIYSQLKKRGNCWRWIVGVVFFSALLLTSSRSAILSFVTGVAVLTIYTRKFPKMIVFTTVILLSIPILYSNFLLGNQAGNHLLKGIDVSNRSFDFKIASSLRYKLFVGGISQFKSNPVVGTGWSNFSTIVNVYTVSNNRTLPAHNMFLQMAVELGAVGLFAILAWFVIILKKLFDLRNSLGMACTAALLVIGLIQGNFLSAETALFWPIALSIKNRHNDTIRYARPAQTRLFNCLQYHGIIISSRGTKL